MLEETGAALVGKRALSRWVDATGSVTWAPCEVKEFDEHSATYLIKWASGDRMKRVRRFNLRVEGEEPGGELEERWLARKLTAMEWRSAAVETYSRLIRAECGGQR